MHEQFHVTQHQITNLTCARRRENGKSVEKEVLICNIYNIYIESRDNVDNNIELISFIT